MADIDINAPGFHEAGLRTSFQGLLKLGDAAQRNLGGGAADVAAGNHSHSGAVAAGSAGFMTGADKAKLDGIATGATKNSTDASLRARASHTGAQAISTVTGLQAALDAKAAAAHAHAIADIDGLSAALATLSLSLPAGSSGYATVAALLADKTAALAPGTLLVAEGFRYKVAPATATDHHLTTAGGVKLRALPVSGLHFTPEQLGYTDALANWGACAQKAWDAGHVLHLGPKEYLTSTTAYVRSRTGVIGEGDRVSGVKAVNGFNGNIIDTENFAARVAGGAVQNDDKAPLGALYGTVLRDFYIDGNRQNFGGTVSATNGIGVRLYCRMPAITNLRIGYTAAHGMQTTLPSGTPDPFDSLDHARIGFVDGLTIMDCGCEGWIFQGPADIPVSRFYLGNNGKYKSGSYDALDPTTSLVFPGSTMDGLVLDNTGAEFTDGHSWNHQHGRGIRMRTDSSGIRARFFNVISEGNWGQVHIESGARVEFYGEIHGNDGGPRNSRLFYDATTSTGPAFAVGQVLTGAISGAVGTITAIETRTASTGVITVSFADDAARERRFVNNEKVSNAGGRAITVHRPDAIGAVPWWRDESQQGNLVSVKVFQVGDNDGGPMMRIQGQNHVYTVQAQSSTPKSGHGIILLGKNITLTGFMEGRARFAADGTTPSAGLHIAPGAKSNRVNLTIKACQQSVLIEDPSASSMLDITSVDPLGDHFNGLGILDAAARKRARLVAVTGDVVV